MKKIILAFIAWFLVIKMHAQFNYNTEVNTFNDSIKKGLYLSWYTNNFFKNNEYFLNTAVGYTLFGSQHIGSVVYKFSDYLEARGGVYIRKDFGTEGFKKITPYYLLRLHKSGYALEFGNINGHVAHKMYDPLWANERLITSNLEEGLSLKVDKTNLYSETWINWERQQYMNANFNEELVVGHHTQVSLFKNKKLHIKLPIQSVIYHSGGQLDTLSNSPIVTLFNAAIGLQAELNFQAKGLEKLSFNTHYLTYSDAAKNSGLPYTSGHAFYSNLNITFTDNFYATLGYWQSNTFIAPKGDILYQSVSTHPKNINYTQPKRNLLQLGLAYKKQLNRYANLSFRVQPFYDFQNKRFDYSYGLFITLNPYVYLSNLIKK